MRLVAQQVGQSKGGNPGAKGTEANEITAAHAITETIAGRRTP